MKPVLIDASSAILLHKAHIFQDVADHYRLKMVPTVFREITVADHSGTEVFKEARESGKIHMVAPERRNRRKIAATLHQGELDTIMAYEGDAAHFIIMDDGKGAKACRRMDIPYINALLCPSILYFSGKIDRALRRSAFRQLKKIGRYGEDIVAYAEKANLDNLSLFLP